jgi:hypothetical protein
MAEEGKVVEILPSLTAQTIRVLDETAGLLRQRSRLFTDPLVRAIVERAADAYVAAAKQLRQDAADEPLAVIAARGRDALAAITALLTESRPRALSLEEVVLLLEVVVAKADARVAEKGVN